jgi:hypothetical protein
MSQNAPLYEPRFYERAAQQHVTHLFPGPICVNVRWGLIGSLATRNELDALVFRTRRAVPVEVKAHSLGDSDTDEIVAKYRRIGFPHIILIAPAISPKVSRRLAGSRAPSVEFILFHPDLDVIRDWYGHGSVVGLRPTVAGSTYTSSSPRQPSDGTAKAGPVPPSTATPPSPLPKSGSRSLITAAISENWNETSWLPVRRHKAAGNKHPTAALTDCDSSS